MDPDSAALVTQFGVAGLIGWMWLTERRAGQDREQKLSEAHAMLAQERTSVSALLKALDDNTRAIATLEGTQRRLIDALDARGLDAPPWATQRTATYPAPAPPPQVPAA